MPEELKKGSSNALRTKALESEAKHLSQILMDGNQKAKNIVQTKINDAGEAEVPGYKPAGTEAAICRISTT
jgi:hypothetical protein